MASKYWYRYNWPHLVYSCKDRGVWVETIEGPNKIGFNWETRFNTTNQNLLKDYAIPYTISILIKQHERYGIRKELLKDILIDIAANIE